MENEAYFTIHEWRGVPEGKTLIVHEKKPTGAVDVIEPISKAIIHSCMVELLVGIRMGILVDVRTKDFDDED